MWNPVRAPVFRGGTSLAKDVASGIAFNRDQSLESQPADENEDGIKRLAVQQKERDREEHRISSHRARKPFVHDRNLMVSRATLNCFSRLYEQEAVIMKRFTVNGLAACFVFVATRAAMNAATVNQRRENQQGRIAQGVKSGHLTAHETASLERKESRLNHQIRNDRRHDDGHLTAGERARVNREQNSLSRHIYRDKHNAAQQ
jgi:hypothetical protein